MNYQSHNGERSVSDSARKLERIRLPSDMSGMRVLDIGCNEGFFCAESVRRGAQEVVGIDANLDALNFARKEYGSMSVQFLHGSWDNLPAGKFDVILWLSSMHYELDPAKIFSKVAQALSPTGLFILECGVADYPIKQMIPFVRPAGDTQFYPSQILLDELVDTWFATREVAAAELTPGDPVPRKVFHCRRRLPTVLYIGGKSTAGKTKLANLLAPSATKVIRIDNTIPNLLLQSPVTPLQQFVHKYCDEGDLEKFFNLLDEVGLTSEYIDLIAAGVAATDKLVVIEGYMTDVQIDTLSKLLVNRAFVWNALRYQM